MAGKTERWPDLGKPATKGDLVSGLIGVNACLVDIFSALSATERGDDIIAKQKIPEILGSLEKLMGRIEAIGGNVDA
jgi:hypothetical protein